MIKLPTLASVVGALVIAACHSSPVAPLVRPERDTPCQEIALQCYYRRAASVAQSRCRAVAYEAEVMRCRGHLTKCLEACRAATDEIEVPPPVPDGAKR